MSLRLIHIGIALAVGPLFAQHSTTRSNPFDTLADREEGARLFRGQCAACHGPAGVGGAAGPDLTAGLRRADSDDALFIIISKGIPGTTMPAFGVSPKEAWQVAAYVRTLSAGKGAKLAKGDKERGAAIFQNSGCLKCHTVGNEGGNLGPDLNSVGLRRSLTQLQQSITEPNNEVSQDFWRLRARTKAGKQIMGVRLNEDSYSFQYRDGGRLASVMKADLAESEILRDSPMPSYRGKFSPVELDDLIAFLATRQEKEAQ